MKKLFIFIIVLFCVVTIVFVLSLNLGISSSIAELTQNDLDSSPYKIDEIKDIYWQDNNKIAHSYYYDINTINNFQQINFITKSSFFKLSLKSYMYFTFFELENGRLYMVFDKKGYEQYSFIINEEPLVFSQFQNLQKNINTFDDVLKIDKSAFLFKNVPKILNAKEPLLNVPFSMHVLNNGDILRIEYTLIADNFVVRDYYICEINASFNVNSFIKTQIFDKNN